MVYTGFITKIIFNVNFLLFLFLFCYTSGLYHSHFYHAVLCIQGGFYYISFTKFRFYDLFCQWIFNVLLYGVLTDVLQNLLSKPLSARKSLASPVRRSL